MNRVVGTSKFFTPSRMTLSKVPQEGTASSLAYVTDIRKKCLLSWQKKWVKNRAEINRKCHVFIRKRNLTMWNLGESEKWKISRLWEWRLLILDVEVCFYDYKTKTVIFKNKVVALLFDVNKALTTTCNVWNPLHSNKNVYVFLR
jgi:hypothetical protein